MVSGQSYMIYFGNIPVKRQTEILVEIAKNGVDKRSVADRSYLSEFLARENLTID